jgi:hypothetical protein
MVLNNKEFSLFFLPRMVLISVEGSGGYRTEKSIIPVGFRRAPAHLLRF